MTRFMTARVAAVSLAAITLLTACTQTNKATQDTPTAAANEAPLTTSVAPTATSSKKTLTKKTEEPLREVRCGPVEVGSDRTHQLIADPTAAGIVGCTEAFNVLDEYIKIPADQKTGPFSEKALSNGWICGADDGITAQISCVSKRDIGDNRNPDALAFHTTQGSP